METASACSALPKSFTSERALVRPVRNLHGSSSDELMAAFMKAREAVLGVLRAIDNAHPNGRDYYPLGDMAFADAVAERLTLSSGLLAVSDELHALADPETTGIIQSRVSNLLAGIPTNTVRPPALHTNGTPALELIDAAKTVFGQANAAIEAIRAVAPNMRDYADSECWVSARDQHSARVETLRRVGGFFLHLALGIRNAQHG
jgi:hypothetical protein